MADIFKKYASIKAYTDYLDANKVTRNFTENQLSQKDDNPKWSGTKSYAEAQNLLAYGDRELQREIEAQGVAKERAQLARYANRRQVYSCIVGLAPNVPNHVAGVPNAMINARQAKVKQNVVNVLYNVSAWGCVAADNIRRAVTKLICALIRLEASGTRVNLWTGSVSRNKQHTQTVGYCIKVKDSGQPFDTLKMCYPLAHPSFLRRQDFRFFEVTPGILKTFVRGYGCPVTDDVRVGNFLRQNGVKTDAVFNYESVKHLSVEDIIKRITDK